MSCGDGIAVDLIPMLVEVIVWGIRNGNSDGLIADLRREFSDRAGPD